MRYFLSILAVVIVVIISIALIARGVHHKTNPPPDVNSYNNSNSSVTQTVTGNLVGEEQRTALQITITQSDRSISILSGYEQNVTNVNTFPNTPAAYTVFLQALQQAGFTRSRITNQQNMFSICPLGDTFQYTLSETGKNVSSLWSTSCFLSDGNFNGDGQLIRQLFQLQIPNFNTFVQSTPNIPNYYTVIG